MSLPPVTRNAEKSRERHGRRSLDIVVEGANSVAIFAQQPESVVVGEVLELDQNPGKTSHAALMNSSTSSSYSAPRSRRRRRPT